MAGFKNDSNNHEILIADNVNFSGDNTPVGKVVSDGQLLIGSSVFPFIVPGLLGSSDGSITWTLGHNTITGQVAGGTSVLKTLTGNSGGVISPTAGNINTLGTGSITISGAGSTLTTQLTGLTANSVLYGLGTATIGLVASGTSGQVLQTNTGAAPTYSTATYPSTTTINQVLYSSAANTITGITAANNGLLITGTTGVPSILANGTTGQVLAATTGSPPSWSNAAASSITITGNSGGGLTGNSFTITGGTTGLTFAGASTTLTLGGTLAIANGGTKATSFTQSNGIVTYNGTSLVNYAGPQLSSGGVMTNTSQPCFSAYINSVKTNVTGDGTNYIMIFDTVSFDNGSNYSNSTGAFTAPVAGKYLFSFSAIGVSATTISELDFFIKVNSTLSYHYLTPQVTTLSQSDHSATQLISLNANDTVVIVAVGFTASSVKNISFSAPANGIYNVFNGYLIC
jgi:hypothetical protein